MKKSLFGISVLTITGLYGLLAAVLIAIFAIAELPILPAILIAIGFMLLQFLISPWLTDLSMRWFYKATFPAELPPYLEAFIRQVCEEQKMKMPRVGLIHDQAPNAFTYGHTKNNARIVITEGILEMLDEEEAKAVVAHELGHATHYDMLLMTMVQLVPLVLYAVFEMMTDYRGGKIDSDSSSSSDDNKGFIIGIIAYVLYLISEYIILWFSRVREYYADEFAAQATRNPNALAGALVKIGFGLVTAPASQDSRHSVASPTTMGISDAKSSSAIVASAVATTGEISGASVHNAMRWDLWNYWAKWYELNSTHPLISKRLLALSAMAPDYGQIPYVTFDEKPDRDYFGTFLKELGIAALPWIAFIATVAAAAVVFFQTDEIPFKVIGIGGLVTVGLSFFKYMYKHPKNFTHHTVEELMAEVNVSGITAIPCEMTGQLIGRGDPGCIFSENFVLRDQTGIVLLNYNQPLKTLNKIFALFRAERYIGQDVYVKGWFRRSPTPYVEMLSFQVLDKTRKLYTYKTGIVIRVILAIACAVLLFL